MTNHPVTGFAERSQAEIDNLYERDFFAWTQEQARLLRALRPAGIDWENAAEEIESLGRSDKRTIESNLAVILLHLLKWQFQEQARKPGWMSSVAEHRRRIAKLVAESPSLRRYPAVVLGEEYELARLKAADETGLPLETFPEECPYAIGDVLDPAFVPKA
ncbi:MAG: DUF29 domain-containing protein [Bauldia sp.]